VDKCINFIYTNGCFTEGKFRNVLTTLFQCFLIASPFRDNLSI
jgi:hypothetical protein